MCHLKGHEKSYLPRYNLFITFWCNFKCYILTWLCVQVFIVSVGVASLQHSLHYNQSVQVAKYFDCYTAINCCAFCCRKMWGSLSILVQSIHSVNPGLLHWNHYMAQINERTTDWCKNQVDYTIFGIFSMLCPSCLVDRRLWPCIH